MKHFVITGASKGIGFELADELAKLGHFVHIAARSAEGLQRLKERHPTSIQAHFVDLEHEDSIAALCASLLGTPLHGLVNNAGLLINKPFDTLSTSDWKRSFDVNLLGPVSLLRGLKPSFVRGAHIVNISSMGGFQGSSKFPGLSAYSAAKGALSILTECLCTEWNKDGIAVNALCLGAVQTDMLETAFPGYSAPVQAAEMGSFIASFLLHAHNVMNGKILPVSLTDPG